MEGSYYSPVHACELSECIWLALCDMNAGLDMLLNFHCIMFNHPHWHPTVQVGSCCMWYNPMHGCSKLNAAYFQNKSFNYLVGSKSNYTECIRAYTPSSSPHENNMKHKKKISRICDASTAMNDRRKPDSLAWKF